MTRFGRMCVVTLVLVLAFCISAFGQVKRFDFGTESSKSPEGWTKVTQHTKYDARAGFGWETALDAVDVTKWWNPQYKDKGVIGAYELGEGDPLGQGCVFGYRFYGWKFDKALDKEGVDRLKTMPNDPIPATFVVDLPDGEYCAFLGLGHAKVSNYQYAPFKVSFNGETKIGLVAPGALAERRVEGIKVTGGKLRVTFEALSEKCNQHPYPWNKFVGWEANFMIVAPKAELDAEVAKVKAMRENAYWDGFAKGTAPKEQVVDGYIVKDGKPFFRLLWHGWGWNDLVAGYKFYCLTNTINNHTMRPFLSFDGYPDANWRKLALEKVRLPEFVDQANAAYRAGFLVNTYSEWTKVLPGAYRDKARFDGDDVDVKGQSTKWEPAVWGKGALEFMTKVHTLMAEHTERHPGVASHEIIEEYWMVPGGYAEPSKQRYREWLAKKYGDVAKLNAEWGTQYKDFAEIQPPPKPNTYTDLTANHVNFELWKASHNVELVKLAYEAVKAVNPNTLAVGGKGAEGIACYDYGQWVDVLHWYGGWDINVARAATDKWNHVLCPVYVNPCGLHKVRGGSPVGTDPFYERYRRGPYPEMISKLLDGVKAIFNEDYVNSPDFHYYHFTKEWKGKKHEGTLGGALEFETEDLPDVFVEDKTLQLARFNQMAYRLAPVVLPTKVPRAQIAVLHTPESFFLFDSRQVYSGTLAHFHSLCQMLHVRHDVIHAADLAAELPKYKVLVLTAAAECVSPEQVETIRKFYKAGGTVILADSALGRDSRTLQYAPFIGEFRKELGIVGTKVRNPNGEIRAVANKFTPSVKEGTVFRTMKQEEQAGTAYDTSAGQTALAKIGDDAVMVANADGRCFALTTGGLRKTYKPVQEFDAGYQALFRDLFTRAGVTPEVTLEGDGRPDRVNAGVLVGKGYWFVGLANFTREPQPVRARLHFLPDGNYEVVDLTGERPIITKDKDGANHLAVDAPMRYAKVLATTTAKELNAKGLDVTLEPLMGRMWMVRPAGQNVLVHAPDFTFRALAKDVVIVPGDSLGNAGKKLAEDVKKAIEAAGGKATVAAEADIKRTKTTNEIKAGGVLLETFVNEPLVTEKNLVLIGSEETNGLVKHLGAAGTFTYDKVLEKVTASHPGRGRGVLAVVDSVNDPAFDATDRSRDAIVIGGSDAAGTDAAVAKLVEIVRGK